MNFHHAAIEISNLEKSITFYQQLGFDLKEKFNFDQEKIAFLVLRGFRLELIETLRSDELSQHTHLAFDVASVDEMLNGNPDIVGRIIEGPYFLNNGWKTIFITGPDSELIEFIEGTNPSV